MFEVNPRNNSGFRITFENGFTISVQWGAGTHSDNLTEDFHHKNLSSRTSEVAIISPTGSLIHPEQEDQIYKNVTPDQLLELLIKTQKLSTFCPNI
jgi:hypothetical protein